MIKHTTVWGMVLCELLKCERRLKTASRYSSLPRIGSMPRVGKNCVISQYAEEPSIRLQSINPSQLHLLSLQLMKRFIRFGADSNLRLPIDAGSTGIVEPTAFEVAKSCTAQAEDIDALFYPPISRPQVRKGMKGGLMSMLLTYIGFGS